MILVVMGVTGCGKTTLGTELANALGLKFHDADEYHPPSNRKKLQNNIPLDDEDRWPWLRAMAEAMPEWESQGGGILACSALKGSYRDILRTGSDDVRFVYIKARKENIAARLKERAILGHILVRDFDKILDGQYRDLEEPDAAIVVSHELPPDVATREVVKLLGASSVCRKP